MKLISNMEVENWDTFNKVYILGDNSNREIQRQKKWGKNLKLSLKLYLE